MLDKWWAHLRHKADGINLHTWAYMMYVHQSGISLASLKYDTKIKALHAALHHIQNLAVLLLRACLTLASERYQQLAWALLTQLLVAVRAKSRPYSRLVWGVDLLICSKFVLDVTTVASTIFFAGKHGVQLASRGGYCHCGHRRQQNFRSGRPWHQRSWHLHRSAA